MSQFWSGKARSITPYTAGEQPRERKYIKLNTNENAYPPSPAVPGAILGAQADGALRLYPPPDCLPFCEAVAAHHALPVSFVFPGNGSDEVLAFAYLAYINPGQGVATAQVSYSFYPVYADLYNMKAERVPMLPGLQVDVDGLIARECPVVIANPNAPTSLGLPLADIRRMADACRARGHALIVDEAYCDFGGESAVPLIGEYDNLLVVRTLSKSHSLAGMRLAYALGQEELLRALWRIRDSFNSYTLDRLALAAGRAAMQDRAYWADCCRKIMATRERFVQALESLSFTLGKPQGNFVFCRHRSMPGQALQQALRDRGILVRRFSEEIIADYLRITIGTDQDMDSVVSALREILPRPT